MQGLILCSWRFAKSRSWFLYKIFLCRTMVHHGCASIIRPHWRLDYSTCWLQKCICTSHDTWKIYDEHPKMFDSETVDDLLFRLHKSLYSDVMLDPNTSSFIRKSCNSAMQISGSWFFLRAINDHGVETDVHLFFKLSRHERITINKFLIFEHFMRQLFHNGSYHQFIQLAQNKLIHSNLQSSPSSFRYPHFTW
jgi:hypothetical protein